MEDIRKKCNSMVDLSKFTSNRKYGDVVLVYKLSLFSNVILIIFENIDLLIAWQLASGNHRERSNCEGFEQSLYRSKTIHWGKY